MSLRRRTILTIEALLTFAFLGLAAYTFFGNPLRPEPSPVQTLPLGQAPQALRLTVYDTGIAAITARHVQNTNFPFSEFNAENLQLTRDGQMVPFYIAGEGNDATLYFFAQAITESMEAPAVYWLTTGRGRTMSQSDRSPTGPGISRGVQWQHWEENRNFQPMATGSDVWLGTNIFAPDSLEVPLIGIQPSGGAGELTVRVWSSNQSPAMPDHHIQVWLNDKQLANHFWDGIEEQTLTMAFDGGDLRRMGNQLRLDVPGDTGAAGESIYLDWIKIEYEGQLDLTRGQLHFRSSANNIRIPGADEESLIFDVSDPRSPVLLLNTEADGEGVTFAGSGPNSTYTVLDPRDAIRPFVSPVPEWEEPLQSPERGADYIAIVPDSGGFMEALEPLLQHRQEQGLRVAAVSLQQVFDEFGYGRQTPEAIRDFLRYTSRDWQPPAPRYVLLVGDATYDVNNYTSGRARNLMPTKLVYTEPGGYVASDTWFVAFDSRATKPELAIGRFPAQSSAQLEVMVKKTIAYETNASPDWVSRALLVADDEMRFNDASDWLADELREHGYFPQKLYMTENEEIRDAIISSVNHGVSIVNYMGHGGLEVWGDEAVLTTSDVSLLRNGVRLPIFTTFTCLNGFFYHPQVDALAETMLATENGGIAAAIAPAGRTYTSAQMPLANGFYEALLRGETGTLGEALRVAKAGAAENPNLQQVIHTVNLLGDPALQFQPPQLVHLQN